MSEMAEAIQQMQDAARGLRFYIKHNCMYQMTDSPEGDVCTCRLLEAVRAANTALARLVTLNDAELGALELGAAARQAGIVK